MLGATLNRGKIFPLLPPLFFQLVWKSRSTISGHIVAIYVLIVWSADMIQREKQPIYVLSEPGAEKTARYCMSLALALASLRHLFSFLCGLTKKLVYS